MTFKLFVKNFVYKMSKRFLSFAFWVAWDLKASKGMRLASGVDWGILALGFRAPESVIVIKLRNLTATVCIT